MTSAVKKSNFFLWYCLETPRHILAAWFNVLTFAFRRYFAIPGLLKSLFSPYRGARWAYPQNVDPLLFLEAIFSNLISRLLGALTRLFIVIFGLAVSLVILGLGPVLLLVWFSPLFVFLSLKTIWVLPFCLFVFAGEAKLFSQRKENPVLRVSLKTALEQPEEYDFKEFLEAGAKKVFGKSLSSDQVFLACLEQKTGFVPFLFNRLLLLAPAPSPTPSNGDDSLIVLRGAAKVSLKWQAERISLAAILVNLAQNSPIFKELLLQNDLKAEDVENLAWWWQATNSRLEEGKRFWQNRNLMKKGGFAPDLTAGYTPTLNLFVSDVTRGLGQKNFEEIIGHQEEISQLERYLAKGEFNNVLLIGEPGSGRGAIVQALAQRVLFGESLKELNDKRVVSLDLRRILSLENREVVLNQVLAEAFNAGNVILVIEDLENFVGSSLKDKGKIDISGGLLKFLKQPAFKIIGVTNFEGLHRAIEVSSVNGFFEKVRVSEVSSQETIKLLELWTPAWEGKSKRFLSYPALREIVRQSEKYLPSSAFPQKATDLVEELLVFVDQVKENVILPEHVNQLISEKTRIPVGQLSLKEKEMLLDLEGLLKERIIGQAEAVREVATALRRSRSGITTRKGPLGTFLFLGPTGVGKTETAKALAATYFGSEEKIVRLDLAEYQNLTDLDRLLGSVEQESPFLTQVRESPFSLVLLDEIEKAHPNILNLFLPVLDEGFLHDGLGRKVSFANTMVIATSNAGYQVILEAIEQKTEMPLVKEKLLNYVFSQGVFRPEFINRFDAVVVFRGLTPENLRGIARLKLKKLQKNLMEKGIDFTSTPELESEVARLGFDPVFGARAMQRVIQDKVENVLAQALLAGELKRGDKISVEVPDFNIKKL